MNKNNIILSLIVVFGFLIIGITVNKNLKNNDPVTPIVQAPIEIEPTLPDKYEITQYPTEYLNHEKVVGCLKQWNSEAPEITEFGTYGEKTPEGNSCYYLRMGTVGKPKILIHSMIHGNERLAGAATLKMMSRLLHEYGREESATWTLNNRDIYWIPVLSPDTYLKSRYVENVDPNRDYPYPGRRTHTPSTPIRNIMEFCTKHKFAGVISGHTTGQDHFYPSLCSKEDQDFHHNLAKKMGDISGYNPSKISASASGYEIDWYYLNGSVAILTEFGVGSHNQPTSTIEPHAEKCYKAYLLFIKEASRS